MLQWSTGSHTRVRENVVMNYRVDDEDYDVKSMIRCPNLDVMINSSRIYYRMIVPHDNYNANWDCTLKAGQKVDVIFTEFAGTDPHDLLIKSASSKSMEVYLPMPAVPDYTEHWPAYFEFTKRVLNSYSARFGAMSAYKGVYQTNEGMCVTMIFVCSFVTLVIV